MRQYELADEYDTRGQRLPNTDRKAAGGKEVREARRGSRGALEQRGNTVILHQEESTPLTVSWQINDGLETVTKTFYPPFTKVDREEDYRIAYDVFKRRYGVKEI